MATRTFPCEVRGCEKVYSRKTILKEHIRTHTGERLVCPTPRCGQTFTRKHDLTVHTKAHGPRQHACHHADVDGRRCGKAFHRERDLERHRNACHIECRREVIPEQVIVSSNDPVQRSSTETVLIRTIMPGGASALRYFDRRITKEEIFSTSHSPEDRDLLFKLSYSEPPDQLRRRANYLMKEMLRRDTTASSYGLQSSHQVEPLGCVLHALYVRLWVEQTSTTEETRTFNSGPGQALCADVVRTVAHQSCKRRHDQVVVTPCIPMLCYWLARMFLILSGRPLCLLCHEIECLNDYSLSQLVSHLIYATSPASESGTTCLESLIADGPIRQAVSNGSMSSTGIRILTTIVREWLKDDIARYLMSRLQQSRKDKRCRHHQHKEI